MSTRRLVASVRVLEAPAAEPVTVAQVQEYCRIDADVLAAQSVIVPLLIQAARERAETITGRAFVQRRLEARYDAFPDGDEIIALPYPPLYSVEYVDYVDANGTLQRLSGSPSQWLEDTGSAPGRIQPLFGTSWPATRDQAGAVRIGYTCGYAPGTGSPTDYAANVPAAVKHWIFARISTWNERREHFDMANVRDLPRDYVDGLLDELRVRLDFA